MNEYDKLKNWYSRNILKGLMSNDPKEISRAKIAEIIYLALVADDKKEEKPIETPW